MISFGGLGIEVGVEDGVVRVVSPIEDTPAFRAGIKSGDLIVKIDDTATRGMPLSKAVEKMRGKPGTDVVLTIFRKGVEQPFDVKLTGEEINVKSVRAKMLEPGYGYIRVRNFQERTGEDLAKAIKDLYKQHNGELSGLVIDLRGDPGGLLNMAVAVSAAFLPKDALVVYTDGRTPDVEHPRWDAVAARCLACGNCTAVCPTCFCHAEADAPALEGQSSQHQRIWDSCFGEVHGHLHGFNVRPDIRGRYGQWLTHKLATWHTSSAAAAASAAAVASPGARSAST